MRPYSSLRLRASRQTGHMAASIPASFSARRIDVRAMIETHIAQV
jgi:hypothetical protein